MKDEKRKQMFGLHTFIQALVPRWHKGVERDGDYV
jgi:hypothetical protein